MRLRDRRSPGGHLPRPGSSSPTPAGDCRTPAPVEGRTSQGSPAPSCRRGRCGESASDRCSSPSSISHDLLEMENKVVASPSLKDNLHMSTDCQGDSLNDTQYIHPSFTTTLPCALAGFISPPCVITVRRAMQASRALSMSFVICAATLENGELTADYNLTSSVFLYSISNPASYL